MAGNPTVSATFSFAGDFQARPDLIRDAANRLGNAALQYAVIFALAWATIRVVALRYQLLGVPLPEGQIEAPWFHGGDLAVVLAVGLSVGLFLLARERHLDVPRVLDLALVYEVLAALGISVAEQWGPWATDQLPRGVSWVAVWVLVFPLVVPTPLRRTILASVAAAATGPLALGLTVWIGQNQLPGPQTLGLLFVPTFLAAGLASFPARLSLRAWKEDERRHLGSYRLEERIGVGGMGEVWRATHHLLKRPAAVKLLSPPRYEEAHRGAVIRQRFEREAMATAALSSPHTVELFDFGVAEDGTFFYVMELLHGVDLDTLVLEHGPLDPHRVVYLLRQVCASLSEAHASGLVHRDVKPANLIACRIGLHYDVVKVVDFGLVKLELPTDVDTTRLTREGHVAGTPSYMAPEAVSGGVVGHLADVYALGCVAYWLLTGLTLFGGGAPLQIALSHVNEEPVPPGQRGAQDVPPELEAVVMACLAKDPADRPAGAAEVEQLLAGCGLDDWGPERAEAWWREHRPWQVVSAASASLATWEDIATEV